MIHEEVISHSITPEYAIHSMDLIKRHMDNLMLEVSRLVDNLEKSRANNLSTIDYLLKENKKLKKIIEESKDA
jgi:hypothetical protein